MMHDIDIDRIREYSAVAAYFLKSHISSLQDHVAVHYPGDAASDAVIDKYLTFCKREGTKHTPMLIVADDEAMQILCSPVPQAMGMYNPLGHYIVIRASVYQDLLEGNTKGEYILAHEVGHASGHPSRRMAMLMGGSVLAGGATGASVWSYLSPDAPQPDAQGSAPAAERPGIMRRVGRAVAAYMATMYSFNVTHSLLMRLEEFRADDKAREGINHNVRYVHALATLVIEQATKQLDPDFVQMQHALMSEQLSEAGLDEKTHGVSNQQMADIILADMLVKGFAQPFGIKDVLVAQSYPSTAQRFQREVRRTGGHVSIDQESSGKRSR